VSSLLKPLLTHLTEIEMPATLEGEELGVSGAADSWEKEAPVGADWTGAEDVVGTW
jgi:hypothetical protein